MKRKPGCGEDDAGERVSKRAPAAEPARIRAMPPQGWRAQYAHLSVYARWYSCAIRTEAVRQSSRYVSSQQLPRNSVTSKT